MGSLNNAMRRAGTWVRSAWSVGSHPATRTTARIVGRIITTCAVILAVVLVTTVSIDLGALGITKSTAEEQGFNYLKRPIHIGRISFRLWTGRFVIDDVVIEGLTPASRPFLRAKHIEVSVPWSTLINKRIVVQSVEMTDWQMHLEVLANGKHSLPKLTPERSSDRKSGWTTTLSWVRAHRGEFTYEDHGTPWSIVTRNLDVTVARPGNEYRGEAKFSNGTIKIQDYVPFSAEMTSAFKIDGGRVVFDQINLNTDGAKSKINGDIDFKYFPEMSYRVESEVDFERIRRIFFAKESFRLSGTGTFAGNFHLFSEPKPDGKNGTGRELYGSFQSARLGVDAYRFDNLSGRVRWTPRRLAVTDASATVFGGQAHFGYEMSPLGVRDVRPTARFNGEVAGLGLQPYTSFLNLEGLRLAGNASGTFDLQWPVGRFSAGRRLTGSMRMTPPAGTTLMTERVPVELIEQGRLPRGPGTVLAPLIPMPIGGELSFDLSPESLHFGPSTIATQRTFVRFEGTTTPGGDGSNIPFHVSSADWQESYREYARMMTATGSPTPVIDIGGYGTADGQLLNDIRRPRIEASFAGDRMRVWDVEWGTALGRVTIENSYADVRETSVTKGPTRIDVDGRFSLGFPRRDGGEEINATVRLVDRPVVDLRHAFEFDDYPLDGKLSGELHLYGNYRTPYSYGTVTMKDGRAYGESFESASASVNLEGKGVRLSSIEVAKSGGRGTGAAYVDWQGSYSFDFSSSTPVPVESVQLVQDYSTAQLPLSGLIDFRASGNGSFDSPRYTVTGTIRDLFAADEGIGQVNIKGLSVSNDKLSIDAEVASPRLDVDVVGTMELSGGKTTDIRFTVNETSLDPYLRAFDPRLSPYTTAVVSGTVNVKGELSRPEALDIATHVSSIDLRLFDYRLHNAGEFDIEFDRNQVTVPRDQPIALWGDDTKLQIWGTVDVGSQMVGVTVAGDANLALLQGVDRNIRSSGNATLSAELRGDLRNPVLTGSLRVQDGRVRHFGAPLALEQMTGVIAFTETAVTVDGLTAQIGGGRIQFDGGVEKQGYVPGQINVSMSSLPGQRVRINYPRDTTTFLGIDRLTLRGTLEDMHLEGEVRVLDALYKQPFPNPNNLLDFLRGDSAAVAPPRTELSLPLTYDGIVIRAESSIRVQNTGEFSARIASSANLELRGTFDQPVLSGDLEIDRGGEVLLLGKRYAVTQGTIYFDNPAKIEPSYDLELETRVRVPGETYRISANIRGTGINLDSPPVFSSDPPLSNEDIYALLISDIPPGQDQELRQARGDTRTQEQFIRELAAQQLAGPISSQVNQTVERALGINFSITPTLIDPNLQSSRPEPGAHMRVTRRLSPRLFLTYSRSMSSSTSDELILVEYDVSDRLTWILSRNEDQTYAIEFRVRRTF